MSSQTFCNGLAQISQYCQIVPVFYRNYKSKRINFLINITPEKPKRSNLVENSMEQMISNQLIEMWRGTIQTKNKCMCL